LKENGLDLNQFLRKESLVRLTSSGCFPSEKSSREMELWSCLFLKEQPFSDVVPRAILVGDSHLSPHFSKNDSYLELTRRIQNLLPTLFMAQTPAALDRGALPGEGTLHCPLFPSLHKKAIVSAKCVVSFHLEPLLVAVANRVPAILIQGRKSEESEIAQKMGVPVVIGQDPKRMVAEIEMYFSHYSWKKIDEFCSELRIELSLSEQIARRFESDPSSAPFVVCSMTDSNYLPFFLGFLENVNNMSYGNFKCFLLALDSNVSKQVKNLKLESQVEVVSIADLWSPDELAVIQKRSVGFRAFSSKPKLIARALKHTCGPVFYCDSDVFFFEPVKQLQSVLEHEEVVLFPHLNDQYPSAQLDGLFNAGMLAVAPGAENFLDWWSELCFRECEFNRERGVVGDQGYLNLVPVLFDKVKIYKKRNHNVARWNSRTLNLRFDPVKPEVPVIDDGTLVSTYHAAFSDEKGVYEMKFIWDQLVSFFSPAYSQGGSKALDVNVRVQQKHYWLHLEYVAKWESFLNKKLISSLLAPLNLEKEFWFSEKGRPWVRSAVMTKRILNHLKIRIHERASSGPNRPVHNNTEGWVNSNLKALQKSGSSRPNSTEAA
jgi:hypothetical protein